MLTDSCGEVEIAVSRDRERSFEPRLVRKRQRRLSDVDEVVLSLSAKELTPVKISAHVADVYGASVSRKRSAGSPTGWSRRCRGWPAWPLEKVYAAAFIDASW